MTDLLKQARELLVKLPTEEFWVAPDEAMQQTTDFIEAVIPVLESQTYKVEITPKEAEDAMRQHMNDARERRVLAILDRALVLTKDPGIHYEDAARIAHEMFTKIEGWTAK